ncbi:hypothetical protein KIH13_16865 [Pseudomonas viridiflava]|nr:hypothetical protein KIH13_16865 [Pseudomonas viridiflava]
MNDHVGGTALMDSERGKDRSAPSVMRYPVNAVIGWNPGRGDALKKASASSTKTATLRHGTDRPAALRIARMPN